MPAAPAPFAPAPYPSIGYQASELKEGKYNIKGGGEIVVSKAPSGSKGDEPGVMGAVSSGGLLRAAISLPVKRMTFRQGQVVSDGSKLVHVGSMTAHNGSNANVPAGSQIAPSQTKVLVAPKSAPRAGSTSEDESFVVELEDGTLCGVCMRNRAITALYRLRVEPQPQTARPRTLAE